MKIAPRSLLRGTHLTATPGNSGLPADELIALTEKLLELTAELVRTAIGLELTEGNIIADNVGETPCLFLASLHRAERAIAERLMRLANGTPPWPRIDLDKALPWVEKRIGLTLTGIALLAAGGLILYERQPTETSNGVECTRTRMISVSDVDGGRPSPGPTGTVRIEFLPENMARFRFEYSEYDFTTPMTTTGSIYTFGYGPDDNRWKNKITIDRESGYYRSDVLTEDPSNNSWTRDTETGTCHATHIEKNM